MSSSYRFLPWTRRGMAAELTNKDGLAALPQRADLPVRLKVNAGAELGVDVQVYGPGDVTGIDTRMIVRTEPRRYTTDFESNYFTAVDFDDPDFPWMFTPAAPGANERLRPWLVLVVIEKQEGVTLTTDQQHLLPVLRIESPADASVELPDLSESWAWAHAQVVTEEDTDAAVKQNLESDPLLNVSRVVCPRRLAPFRDYMALLVPAFDAGRLSGLGRTPPTGNIGPAWTNESSIELPVYFHWDFSTGPAGDFEALADRLEPRAVPPGVGSQPMFIGRAGPGITELDPTDAGAILGMEGALRAPKIGSGTSITDVPSAIQGDLRSVLATTQEQLANGADDDDLAIVPPLYARWHQRQHDTPSGNPRWMRELNLDPRFRSAAGLGAQVIREFQEEFMNLAWQQVGDINEANQLLAWAILAKELGRRLHTRHFAPLDADSLLKISAPMHPRILNNAQTILADLHESRLPNQVVDIGFRRLTASQNVRAKRTARLEGISTDTAGGFASATLTKLNTGTLDIEPTNIPADGITDITDLDQLGRAVDGRIDISVLGGVGGVSSNLLESAEEHIALGVVEPAAIAIRPNIRASGVITSDHLEAIRAGTTDVGASVSDQLETLIELAATTPSTHGFLIAPQVGTATPTIESLVVDGSGNLSIHRPGNTPNIHLGVLTRAATRRTINAGRLTPSRGVNRLRSPRGGTDHLPETMASTPVVGAHVPTIVVSDGINEKPAGVVVGDLVREAAFIDSLIGAISENVAMFDPGDNVIFEPPSLQLSDIKTTILTTINPERVVPLRIRSLIRFGDQSLTNVSTLGGLTLAEDLGPVMAAPSLIQPMYESLVAYNRNAFLPGVDLIPPDTITLLETNPRFIESHMIGLNVEFARELLWREFPTDRRGTYFRQFWDRVDDELDIPEIHRFRSNSGLGKNLLGAGDDHIVLLIRGQLLRRYPGTAVYAVPRTTDGRIDPDDDKIVEPMLWGRIDPDITFIGFDLTVEDLRRDPGWFFVLQEPPTEPRFGFDEPSDDNTGPPMKWAEADWSDVGVSIGQHLAIAGNTMANRNFDGIQFATNSAHLAALSLQQPVRVAMLASEALGDIDG